MSHTSAPRSINAEDCEGIVGAVRNDEVSCIVLGWGEDDATVHEWPVGAPTVPELHRVRGGMH